MTQSDKSSERARKNARALDSSHVERNLGERTIAGGLIGVSGKAGQILVQLAQAAILARLLAPEDFGLLAMAMVVTGFVGLFTELGLATATIQRKRVDQNLVSALFFINLAVGLVIMISAWLVAPFAAWTFGDPRVTDLVIVLSISIPIAAGWAQHRALLNRQMRWRTLRANILISQVFALCVAVTIASATDYGYWALAAGMLSQHSVAFILGWAVMDWRPSRVTDWAGVRSALTFGANLTVFTFANWLNRNLDNALIGWRWGASELGFYTRAYQLLKLPITLISGPITGAVIPSLSRLQDQPDRWRVRILEAMSAVFIIAYALTTFMVATSDALVLLVFGAAWSKSADILLVLLFAMYGANVANVTGWIYITLGNTKRMAIWGGIRLPITVVGIIIGLPYGAVGVAAGFAGAALVSLIPCVMFAVNGTPLSAYSVLRIAVGPAAISIAAALAGRAMGNPGGAQDSAQAILSILVAGGVSGVLYLIGLGALFLFDENMRMSQARLLRLAGDRLKSRPGGLKGGEPD